MGPGQIFDEIRGLYLERFKRCVSEVDPSYKLLLEPALLTKDGSYAIEGDLSLPCRMDLVVLRNGVAEDSIAIDSDRILSFDAFSFPWDNGVRILVNPFQWDYCTCGLAEGVERPDWTPIRDWFQKWFEEDGTEPAGPFKCVHYLSDPQATESGFDLLIDFGSAPVDALEELFDAVGSTGFKALRLGDP